MKKILVVDDEQEIVELVRARLETNGYRVISAFDGKEGVEKAKQEKPDLILMDISMPRMMGGEAAKLLKADAATKHIPIMFLTAVASKVAPGEPGSGINIGGEFIPSIAKPFDSQELLTVARKLCGEGP